MSTKVQKVSHDMLKVSTEQLLLQCIRIVPQSGCIFNMYSLLFGIFTLQMK